MRRPGMGMRLATYYRKRNDADKAYPQSHERNGQGNGDLDDITKGLVTRHKYQINLFC